MPTKSPFESVRDSALSIPLKDPVHVVFATNAGYVMPLCVTLASLVEHFDPTRDLVLHLISNEASDQIRENVRRTVEMNRPGLDHIEINWYGIDPSLLHDLSVPAETHFSADVYTRILAPLILPESCEKVIYLDCDVIVLTDLSFLWDQASGGTILHAVHEIGTPWVSSRSGVFDYRERGISPDARYFNTGILVIDFRQWRARNLTPAIIDYVVRNGDRIFAVDQGALNAFLPLDWTPLDPRWNQGFSILFPELWTAAGYSRKDWRRAKNYPYIVHFSGKKKPWHPGVYSPRYSYFYRYLAKTVYRGSVPHRQWLENVLGLRAYYQLWRWVRRLIGKGAS